MSTSHTQFMGSDVSFPAADRWLGYWLFILRMVAGWWLLHAGLDKFMTWPFNAGWFVGGRAAATSLAPFVTLFSDGLGLAFVNIMIPLGQTLIGIGLILGALTRTAAFFGAFLMIFFYFINGETGGWAHGLVTGDLLGLLIFGLIATLGAGRIWGVDAYLLRTNFVQSYPRLRYLMG